ncbi:hypothetical protein Y032_0193g1402 [Ancylostoma ceylanicum]|uniref:Uncharacterized protein n=1 Tax=Ancylostoma ceylanicum TaxID=53326 RepID=A0A016SPI4_9BILA|nr:hypothetical protein Y032_0193g1402 [Ancylostoma ceylanicum]
MSRIAEHLFEETTKTSVGLWAYGYTNFTGSLQKATLKSMRKTFEGFNDDLNANMKIFDTKNPSSTKNAVNSINQAPYQGKANCVVFFTAVYVSSKFISRQCTILIFPHNLRKEASGMSKVNPTKLDGPKRAVVVSLRGRFYVVTPRSQTMNVSLGNGAQPRSVISPFE